MLGFEQCCNKMCLRFSYFHEVYKSVVHSKEGSMEDAFSMVEINSGLRIALWW